jgi:hypothetical protein
MSNMYARVGATALSAASLLLLSPVAIAVADPKGATFSLVCGNATYTVVTPRGHGTFTPAFATDSNRVFVPVSFGPFTGHLYSLSTLSGTPVDRAITEPAVTKGGGKQPNTTACSYAYTDTFTVTPAEAAAGDPNSPDWLPAGTYCFDGSGAVVGQVVGR